MRVRDAIRDLPASRIGEISALGMGDPTVIPLWYGEGDLPTPDFIGAAATAALEAGHTFYTYKAGLPELRSAIADYLTGLYARPTEAERIVVSSSGMNALMLVAEALIDPGDISSSSPRSGPTSPLRFRSWAASRALSRSTPCPGAAGASTSSGSLPRATRVPAGSLSIRRRTRPAG